MYFGGRANGIGWQIEYGVYEEDESRMASRSLV